LLAPTNLSGRSFFAFDGGVPFVLAGDSAHQSTPVRYGKVAAWSTGRAEG
jgi:hypothetical protein